MNKKPTVSITSYITQNKFEINSKNKTITNISKNADEAIQFIRELNKFQHLYTGILIEFLIKIIRFESSFDMFNFGFFNVEPCLNPLCYMINSEINKVFNVTIIDNNDESFNESIKEYPSKYDKNDITSEICNIMLANDYMQMWYETKKLPFRLLFNIVGAIFAKTDPFAPWIPRYGLLFRDFIFKLIHNWNKFKILFAYLIEVCDCFDGDELYSDIPCGFETDKYIIHGISDLMIGNNVIDVKCVKNNQWKDWCRQLHMYAYSIAKDRKQKTADYKLWIVNVYYNQICKFEYDPDFEYNLMNNIISPESIRKKEICRHAREELDKLKLIVRKFETKIKHKLMKKVIQAFIKNINE